MSPTTSNRPYVWLVTGCSTGFGRHFIEAILARGDKAIATARRLESIADLAQKGAATMQLDVDVSPQAIEAKVQEAIQVYGHVDVLINNAGYGALGTIEDVAHDTLVAQFQTNVFGPVNLTRAILPHFRAREAGTIVLVSSIGYLANIPGAGAYLASKAAIDSLFGTLSLELQSSPIRTLILQPGSYRTEIIAPSKYTSVAPPSEPYRELMEGVRGQLNEEHGKQPGDPVKFAKVVVDMVSAGTYEGKALPTRLVFGSDAVAIGKAIQTESLKNIDEWESVSLSTNVEE